MKILLVVHNFLPLHTAGTEVYTAQLGRHLARRGHDVHVFTAEKDIAARDLSVREREHAGLAVTEIVNNLFHDEFRATWDHPGVAGAFGALLDRFGPDVVHVQHLMYLSIGCVEEARRRGIPVLFTLHDYWLHCPRFGQRVHADDSICHAIDLDRCGDCMARFKHAQTPMARRAGRAIAALRGKTGVDLGRAARGTARLLGQNGGAAGPADWSAGPEAAAAMTRQLALRDRAMRDRLVPLVHMFLSPSRFLRERFVEWGIPPEQVRYLRTGIDLEHFGEGARTPSTGTVRVGFIGTVAPHKGVHLLLDAWDRLEPGVRARARLELIGSTQYHADYVAGVRRRAQALGVSMRPPVPREAVADELRAIDLLVVPSVWYENSPLVIIEAIAVRTPLLVSAIGGMAELVTEGRSGFHFRVGDAGDLAQHLERLIAEPGRLAALYSESEEIKRVEEDAGQLEELYLVALESERAGRPADGRPA